MKKILAKTSNWRFIISAFLICVFCIFQFEQAQRVMSQIAGEEVTTIDVLKTYSLKEINQLFGKLQHEGREIHRQTTKVTDMIFPFGYGLLFILLSAFFLKKITRPEANWMYLSLIPILLVLVDFKENFNTLNLLEAYPNLTVEMVDSASKVTHFKTFLVYIFILMPTILGVIWGVKWRKKISRKKSL